MDLISRKTSYPGGEILPCVKRWYIMNRSGKKSWSIPAPLEWKSLPCTPNSIYFHSINPLKSLTHMQSRVKSQDKYDIYIKVCWPIRQMITGSWCWKSDSPKLTWQYRSYLIFNSEFSLHTAGGPELWIDQSGFSRRAILYCPDVNVC